MVFAHGRHLRDKPCVPQIFLRLFLDGPIPWLKAFDQAAVAVMLVADVKGSHAMRAWMAYYVVGKERLTYAGEA
jgi:hypothetical protein